MEDLELSRFWPATGFCVSTNDISSGAVGGAETPQFLLKNPVGSGKVLRLTRLVLCTNVSTNNNIFRLYQNPTITGPGTVLPIVPAWSKSYPSLSAMLAYKVPTVSANGILLSNFCVGPTSSLMIGLDPYFLFEEGKSLLIGVRPNTTGVTFNVNAYWQEIFA